MSTVLGEASAVSWRLQNRFRSSSHIQLITKDFEEYLLSFHDIIVRIADEAAARHKTPRDEVHAKELGELRKTLYSIENLVDSYEVGVASSSGTGGRGGHCTISGILKRISDRKANQNFRAELSRLTARMRGCLNRLVNIIAELDIIRELREGHILNPSNSLRDRQGHLPWVGTGVLSDAEDIIRIYDDEEELLISALTCPSRAHIEVISICGTAGIGKTTLAKILYNDPRVQSHFDIRAWVVVTQEFQTRHVFLSMASCFGLPSSELSRITEMDLAETVYRYLKGRRWLVVLDDIWSTEAWMSIRSAFPDDHYGSRVLTTTRSMFVAEYLSFDHQGVHSMRLLDADQSRKLLLGRMTRSRDAKLTPKWEKIAEEIARRSNGLPLAIVVFAHMLKSKPEDEWESLLRYDDAGISGTQSFGEVTKILSLSYDSLPSLLKPCFLYMGNFPKGSKIEVDTLCQLWIAEGFVSETTYTGERPLMEVAVDYFHELAARNLVQLPEEEMSNRQGFSYGSLYDLMRDICIKKAKEDDFFEIVTPEYENQSTHSVFRHAIYLDKHGDMDIRPYLGSELRTLLFFNSFHQHGDESVFPQAIPDLMNLKWMRILHFEGVDFEDGKLPAGIGNLVLLRHLSFRDCYMEELPSSIGNLILLLNLDLRVRKRCRVAIPNVLFKLERLRHLYLPLKFQTKDDDKLQFDGMKELEVLKNFDTSMCNAREISKLTKLRELAVCAEGNLEDLEMIFQCIEGNADHLNKTTLDIRNFDSYSAARLSFVEKLFKCHVLHVLRLEGRILKIPEADAISENFTEIHLSGSQLNDDPMETLHILPNLRILALETEAYTGEQICCNYGFHELRSLKLSKLYNLEILQVKDGAMQKLSTLSIENCRRMEKLPEGLEFMNTLRKFKINMMPKQFVARIQKVDGKGGEDLAKINPRCIIEFGNEPQLTNSTTEQNNPFQGTNFEFQMSTSTETPYFARRSACPPQNEWERDVYLQ